MKLYLFGAGVLKSYKQFFVMGAGAGESFDVPVPFVLIDHPKGLVLFDTGNAREVVTDKNKHWGDIVAAYNVEMSDEQWCCNAIRKVGYKPEDVKYVILSHLHLDHAGGVGQFPNARYIVHRDEIHYAYVPDSFMKLAYIRADFDRNVNWFFLEGAKDDGFDLFGDGTITTIFTPGHTPGHQSLVVNMPKSGKLIFAADACYTTENKEGAPSGLAWNFGEAAKSVNKMLMIEQAQDAKLFVSHDPEAWKTYKIAPEFYE